ILGKNNMVELAYGGWGHNEPFGTARNPWDNVVPRVPGGSSSGSAVAVATGRVPYSVGSDTGGSIRIPASYCALVGLKTTPGRISVGGVLPLRKTMDTLGPIAKCVDDAHLLYDILCGDVPAVAANPDQPPNKAPDLTGMHLACIPDYERSGVSPDVLRAYDAAIKVFTEAGATVGPVSLPVDFQTCSARSATIVAAEAYREYVKLASDPSIPLGSNIRARL